MPLRFLHTADWQLSKPFAGITDATKRHTVQAERITVLDRIATRAAGLGFVVLAPSPETLALTPGQARELWIPWTMIRIVRLR